MTKRNESYRRLSRPGLRIEGLFSITKLWLGKDHLLLSTWYGFYEEYRRFYFKDIQAVLLRQTKRREWIDLAWAMCVLGSVLLGVTGFFVTKEWIWIQGWSIVSGGFLLGLTVNHLLGPGCQMILQTAVQKSTVKCVTRLREARRILSMVRPVIHEAQRK